MSGFTPDVTVEPECCADPVVAVEAPAGQHSPKDASAIAAHTQIPNFRILYVSLLIGWSTLMALERVNHNDNVFTTIVTPFVMPIHSSR